jgi:hypothetical protein
MIAYTVSFSATPRMAKSVPAPDLIFTFSPEQRKYCVYSTTGVGGVDELEEFEEPVYQYVSVGDKRFVLLESGVYLI